MPPTPHDALLLPNWPRSRKVVIGMIHLPPLPGSPRYGGDVRSVREAALRWKQEVRVSRRRARSQLRRRHYLELRYEDLVTDTEPNLRKIADFLELEWDPVMLSFYERAADRMSEMARDLPASEGKPTRPGDERMQAHAMTQKPPDPSAMYRWKERMSPEDVAAFDAEAGELLSELGYEVGTASPR